MERDSVNKTEALDLVSGKSFKAEENRLSFRAVPGVNYVLDIR